MKHSHHHVDWATRAADLIAEAEVHAPMVDRALAWLAQRVPGATRVLDVGSGPGVAACSFAALLPSATGIAADGAAARGSARSRRPCRTGSPPCRTPTSSG